jgi:hypothetical protein
VLRPHQLTQQVLVVVVMQRGRGVAYR